MDIQDNTNVTVDVIAMGDSRKTVTLDITGCHTVRSAIVRNYLKLCGSDAPSSIDTWNEIGTVKDITNLSSWRMTKDGITFLNAADLFPSFDVEKYTLICASSIRSSETIEQYVETLLQPAKTDSVSKSQLTGLLLQPKTQLVLRQALEKSQSFLASPFTTLLFPSNVLKVISEPALNYYNIFLERFIGHILMLRNCVELSKNGNETSVKECARHWLEEHLYQLQIQFLTLFVVPEVFLRTKTGSNYGVSLQKLKFNNPWGKEKQAEEDYCNGTMAGRTLSEVFTTLLKSHSITSFDEFLLACQRSQSTSFASSILNTLRIYLNKTKHASGVEVIRSLPAREQREWRLKKIDNERNRLKGPQGEASFVREEHLKWDEEFERNVSYAFEDYNFEDPHFLRNNGIRVSLGDVNSNGTDPHLLLTLGDMEIALKILAGAMCILTAATANSRE